MVSRGSRRGSPLDEARVLPAARRKPRRTMPIIPHTDFQRSELIEAETTLKKHCLALSGASRADARYTWAPFTKRKEIANRR